MCHHLLIRVSARKGQSGLLFWAGLHGSMGRSAVSANDIKCRFVVVGHINQQKATAKSESRVDMALSADTGGTEHETIGLVSRLWSLY